MRALQIFSFKKSVYERPNQKWICGRACLGDPCLAGPDLKGRCQATCECRPLKKGDRWHCTRPASLGGPCEAGPLPNGQCCRPVPKCHPVKSLRAWRGLSVVLVATATTSALLVGLTLKPEVGQALVSPGELSFQHSTYKSHCWRRHCQCPTQGPSSLLAALPRIFLTAGSPIVVLALKYSQPRPRSFAHPRCRQSAWQTSHAARCRPEGLQRQAVAATD